MLNEIKDAVSNYYGEVIQQTEDLQYDACCTTEYDPALLQKLTEEVLNKRYGCGSPLPTSMEGKTVLDLGSGAGADCFIASQLVGQEGAVIGVDMTKEQLDIARRNIEPHMQNFGYTKANVRFLEGMIEQIPVEDQSIDVVISNCVINLSTDKQTVFEEIWRVLKEGGEFYIADIVADRRIPKRLQHDDMLWSECLTGALYDDDLRRIMEKAGFFDVRAVSTRRLADQIEGIGFYSRILRGFKLPLEDRCEDYGQNAIYKGTIKGHEQQWTLDANHHFVAGRAYRVCKNTADILNGSRFSEHFVVSEPMMHLGAFDCHATQGEETQQLHPLQCC